MVIKGKDISIVKIFFLILYYGFARHLPNSNSCWKIGGIIRRFVCRHIFKKCGKNINIERKAWFASGIEIEIGDNSGIGINAHIPNGTIIGDNVMMGPNCFILDVNHNYSNTNIPMSFQGFQKKKITKIGNDVWIGRDVFITPGRIISDHSIIAARSVLCKDFPEYSIIGGNPSKVIRDRRKTFRY